MKYDIMKWFDASLTYITFSQLFPDEDVRISSYAKIDLERGVPKLSLVVNETSKLVNFCAIDKWIFKFSFI